MIFAPRTENRKDTLRAQPPQRDFPWLLKIDMIEQVMRMANFSIVFAVRAIWGEGVDAIVRQRTAYSFCLSHRVFKTSFL